MLVHDLIVLKVLIDLLQNDLHNLYDLGFQGSHQSRMPSVSQHSFDDAIDHITQLIIQQQQTVEQQLTAFRQEVDNRISAISPPAQPQSAQPEVHFAVYACVKNKVAFATLQQAREYFQVGDAVEFPLNTDVRGFITLDAAREACEQPFLQVIPQQQQQQPPQQPPVPLQQPLQQEPLFDPAQGAVLPPSGSFFQLDAATLNEITYVSKLPPHEAVNFRDDASRDRVEAEHTYTIAAFIAQALDGLARVEQFLTNDPHTRELLADAVGALQQASYVARGRFDVLSTAARIAPSERPNAIRLATQRVFPTAAAALTSSGAALLQTISDRNVAALATALATPPRRVANPGRGDGGRGRGDGTGRGGRGGRY